MAVEQRVPHQPKKRGKKRVCTDNETRRLKSGLAQCLGNLFDSGELVRDALKPIFVRFVFGTRKKYEKGNNNQCHNSQGVHNDEAMTADGW